MPYWKMMILQSSGWINLFNGELRTPVEEVGQGIKYARGCQDTRDPDRYVVLRVLCVYLDFQPSVAGVNPI